MDIYSSLTIANRFLKLADKDGRALTPLKLLKIVYIAHGWMLGLYGRPLIKDRVEAWKYGPVIPDLYRHIKGFRDMPVKFPLDAPKDDNFNKDKTGGDLVQKVYDVYGKYDGVSLSTMTHQPGSPWERVYEDGVSNIPISNDLIESHYRARAE